VHCVGGVYQTSGVAMKQFRLSTLMLLFVIAALVAALVVESQRAERIALARARAKLEQLWDDPAVRNQRSETEKPPNTAKSYAVEVER
jgi:hypothetical protein